MKTWKHAILSTTPVLALIGLAFGMHLGGAFEAEPTIVLTIPAKIPKPKVTETRRTNPPSQRTRRPVEQVSVTIPALSVAITTPTPSPSPTRVKETPVSTPTPTPPSPGGTPPACPEGMHNPQWIDGQWKCEPIVATESPSSEGSGETD